MSRIKQIGTWLAVVAILWVFTAIMTNSILCNFAHSVDATEQEHEHPYGHDHHHDGHSPPANNGHKDTGHDHDKDSGEDCCIDFTFNFFSSLQRDYNPTFKISQAVIIHTSSLPVFTNPMAGKNWNKGEGDYNLPPPNIPDIRVCIQSFQI